MLGIRGLIAHIKLLVSSLGHHPPVTVCEVRLMSILTSEMSSLGPVGRAGLSHWTTKWEAGTSGNSSRWVFIKTGEWIIRQPSIDVSTIILWLYVYCLWCLLALVIFDTIDVSSILIPTCICLLYIFDGGRICMLPRTSFTAQ